MNKYKTACVLFTLVASASRAGVTESISDAIERGPVDLDFRYRYELVDDSSLARDARANTLRSRLTFAPSFNDRWQALLEFDDVRHVGSVRFNDTRNGRISYPLVLDPEGTDFNQVHISYSGLNQTVGTFGRQRINRGNQRFIGGVGWRQNEQTYDSVSLNYGDDGPISAYYAYVFQVNRIFGPEQGSPARSIDAKSHLLDLRYRFSEQLDVSAYNYWLDFKDAPALANTTYGLRLNSVMPLPGEFSLTLGGEYARQQDIGNNPVNYDATYYRIDVQFRHPRLVIMGGYEVLGGSDNGITGGGFRTPLATLHKFQGWADKFATASGAGSDSGIRDAFATLSLPSSPLAGGRFMLTYHDFEADKGGADLGSEIDASAAWTIGNHYGVLLKYARYDGSGSISNLSKFWLQLTASF